MKIDGKVIAQEILEEIKKEVIKLKKKKINPHLAIILVGNDPSSEAYVRQKEIKAKEVGIKTTILYLPANITQEELFVTIEKFNNDNNVHGLIVQQPLPNQINEKKTVLKVNPRKDIDGLQPKSFYPMPLAVAILKILEDVFVRLNLEKGATFKQWLKTQNIVVLGKGETGGGPIIKILKKSKVELAIIDSKTKNSKDLIKKADIIVTAVGKPDILKTEMFKKNVVLIGVGLYRGEDNKLHTDYNQEEIKDIASFYTPVPGGVGPVNVSMLLKNLVNASKNC